MVTINKIVLATVCLWIALPPSGAAAERANEGLVKQPSQVCGLPMTLEIADTPESRATGLMHRRGVEKNTGMLFVFPQEQVLTFWMKNVDFDIDIGFFDKNAKLVASFTMAATSPVMKDESLPQYSSGKKALYAIEAQSGFFKNKKGCRFKPLPPAKGH